MQIIQITTTVQLWSDWVDFVARIAIKISSFVMGVSEFVILIKQMSAEVCDCCANFLQLGC